jgi:hypothetical protein
VVVGDLYRPDDDRPRPALLNYYPYRKDDVIGSLFEGTRRRVVERGYADLLVDMTGTGGSEGEYGETFDLEREGRDAAEIVEWVAAQDWCDGNVGIWGVSYGGFIALAAACQRPPHLRAIVPVYATTDNRERIAPGGCLTCFGFYSWTAHMLAMDLLPPTFEDVGGRWRRTWEQRLQRMRRELPHGVEWQTHPRGHEYWSAGRVDAAGVDVPALLIAGWRDIYTDPMLKIYDRLGGPRRLVVGPWMHVLPHLSDVEPWDWEGAMADWWDRYLVPEGSSSGRAERSVLYFVQGANIWRGEEQWPPAGTSELSLYLAGNRLQSGAEADDAALTYVGDPTVGVAAGVWDPFGTGLGWPEEQSSDAVRSLTFTTDPFEVPVVLAGRATVELLVGVEDGEEAQVSVKLSAVRPDGSSVLITSGMHLCPQVGADGGRGSSATPQVRTVRLGATAFALDIGDRLRLAVATADFPHFWPTPTNPRITLWCGGEQPSVLRLPVSAQSEGVGHNSVQVVRPTVEPGGGWVEFGKPSHVVETDRGNGRVTVSLGWRTQMKTPAGAVVNNDEMFSASVQRARPDAARLEGRSLFQIDMPAGERVVVQTKGLYGRQASICHGSVLVDGVLVFEHCWNNWGGGM